jgi:hypothetical protein
LTGLKGQQGLPLYFSTCYSGKSQANIIHCPAPVGVSQGGFASPAYFIKKGLPVMLFNCVGKGLGKNFQPIEKLSGERRRSLNDFDGANRETRIHQKVREIFRRRKVPRIYG